VQRRDHPRRVRVHAARLPAAAAFDRSTLSTRGRVDAAPVANGEVARELRARSAPRVADHRDDRGRGAVAVRGARLVTRRRQVRAALWSVYGDHGADPIPRSLAGGDPPVSLRASRASGLPRRGRAAVSWDPPDLVTPR